jgi:hypothetical protein
VQKPTFKDLQNEINNLLDYVKTDQFSRDTLQTQIMNVLIDTYNTLNKLDECRIENEHLGRFENNLTSVQKYIDYYQDSLNQAKEKEDKNLEFRHAFAMEVYKGFFENPEKALSLLRYMIASNTVYEIDHDVLEYENFLSQHDPKMLFTTQRNYANKDLFLNLYKRLEGYQITRDKIIKSAGLKIFTFFDVVTKVQKTKLAKYIEYLFASLGEDLKLESKHAGSIKVIGEFSGFVLFDYMRNKKGELYDFGLEAAFNHALKAVVMRFKKQGNLTMVRRINNNRKMMEAGLLAHLLT